ncbi:MAG TPA: class II glutamine amidotransferase, partial [Polyangiaceae bacterium]|nr:class II glutamine amidotransferase [Polyangiaceae bacterium]
AAPPRGSIRSEIVKAWEHLEASLFLLHIRSATWGSISDANTQPFCRSFGGRDFLLAHSGSLVERLTPKGGAFFQPVGSTDSELIFCELLLWLSQRGAKSLSDVPPADLRAFMEELNGNGSLTLAMSDGRDLLVYADLTGESSVHVGKVQPPFEKLVVSDEDVEVDFTRRGAKSRKGLFFASNPMDGEGASIEWTTLEPGGLLLARQGIIVAEAKRPSQPAPAIIDFRRGPSRPMKSEPSRFSVVHRTVYRYARPVERSSHHLRLEPAHDKMQSLVDHELTISVAGQERAYQDVFGNQVRKLALDTPFTELAIEARSRVLLLDTDPLGFRPLRQRTKIPLVWMPWQWHMLQPFLLPPELPESQLVELSEYAMSFVERNDYDLLDTLLDLNASIFREYKYKTGLTTISTTPFEVYVSRCGVCQDFANLFICLSRLLGVPARYVCGYIYTGPKNPNQLQSEASHAWVQVYLPEIGWKGFDPTNGVLTQTSHIRVAVGRSYVDATPTSGTIFVGGGGETLEVNVRVEPVD